jgi:hypothetical protein
VGFPAFRVRLFEVARAFAGFAIFFGIGSYAAALNVTTLNDTLDGDTTSITALQNTPGPDGFISLAEAILAANNTAGQDLIDISLSGTINTFGMPTLSDDAGAIINGFGNVTLDGASKRDGEKGSKGSLGAFDLSSSNNTIKGFTIINFPMPGVFISGDNNVVHGCKIGTDGVVDQGNAVAGVLVEGGVNNVVGGTNAGEGNVISGTDGDGIEVSFNASFTIIQGNIIGLNAAGTAAIPNNLSGIEIFGTDTKIGSEISLGRNVISGNAENGIAVGSSGKAIGGTVIEGNYIGTNSAGTAAIGNGLHGIVVDGQDAHIGGSISKRNFICGNGNNGILFLGAATTDSFIKSNVIGLAPFDLSVLGNNLSGIALVSGTSGVIVGGLTKGDNAGNLIAGNGALGVLISNSNSNIVDGNFIGTDETGTRIIGNASDGIGIFTSKSNIIGGASGNAIHNNTGAGVRIDTFQPQGNLISANSIHNNFNGGIVYDNGPFLDAPEIQLLTPFFGTAPGNSTVELYADESNEGRLFLGSTTASANGVFSFNVDVQALNGLHLTVLAHDATGETSEFSPPFAVGDDSDNDGLTDDSETNVVGTNPANFDTDGDGIGDGREFNAGLNPNDPADALTDADGDGLTSIDELNETFTDPFLPDTDSDGMPDGFEVLYRLLPRNAFDGGLDPDGDALSNFAESGLRSDPRNANSPTATFFVSNGGIDSPGRGTQGSPWETIGFALTQFSSTVGDPVRLILAPGTYNENVVMQPGLAIAGALGTTATINGTGPVVVTGADGAALFNLQLGQAGARAPKVVTSFLTISNVAMTVRRVTFIGTGTETGIVVTGAAAADGLITNCTFSNLIFGIDVSDAVPNVRKNVFDNIGTNSIIIRTLLKLGAKDLGNSADPNTGFNTFGDSGAAAVDNETETPVDMQNNDWGTDSVAEVGDRVDGPGTVEPFLPKGTGILPGALTCTVWDSVSLAPITDAVVNLTGTIAFSSSENSGGVYPFASLAPGGYTVTVSAPDHTSSIPTAIVLGSADIESLSFALDPGETGADTDGDGLTNDDETNVFGTNPSNVDTDSDGLNDDVEVAYGSDPKSVELARTTDINADGQINAVDIQLVINSALNLFIVGNGDVDRNGSVNASDVQFVILFALDLSKSRSGMKYLRVSWPYENRFGRPAALRELVQRVQLSGVYSPSVGASAPMESAFEAGSP